MPAHTLQKVDKKTVGFFRFKKKNGRYLITNDLGEHSWLTPKQFFLFVEGKIQRASPQKYTELRNKNFIKDSIDFYGAAQKYALKNSFIHQGTSLHIIVVTLRCDHGCVYCQTSSRPPKEKTLDMSVDTARQAVNRIFESPSKKITIEFQGGEPLLNFNTVKFIVEYAQEKNKNEKKDLLITLVSNLGAMSEEKLSFLTSRKVCICTSLDGPEKLHNSQRPHLSGKNSYKNTVGWLKKIRKEHTEGRYPQKLNALTTITRASLSYPKAIVDEYVKQGLEAIHLRPATPFGLAKNIWNTLNYSPDEFFRFYRASLDYILERNRKGTRIYERTACIFLKKIITQTDPNYLDLRSPCGAGIGQLAYNYNGDVYTCDEGRMLSAMGDDSFKIGNVATMNYQEFVASDVVKTTCVASCLENIPGCSVCVYSPFCGVCPIYNYAESGNIFGKEPHNDQCKIHTLILDYLFEKTQDAKYNAIIKTWVNEYG